MKNSMTIPMTRSGSEKKVSELSKLYNSLLNEFKTGQIGYGAIAVLAQSCIGSAAVMILFMNDIPTTVKMILVFLVTLFCMSFNAAVLAQLKSKITFNLLISSVVFSSVIILANLF